MKSKILIITLFLLSFSTLSAQNWLTDFEEAKTIAKKDHKKLIMSFQGSDWCAPCIKLDHEYFSNSEFKTYAKEHFVMLKVDFPRRKKNRLAKDQTKHNNNLAEKYNAKGNFPLVVVLDSNGKVLGKLGYSTKINISEFIQKIENFK